MMTDEELIYNYRMGNMEALSLLFYSYGKKVIPFYRKYENIFRLIGYDDDDMKGFVRSTVLQSIDKYTFGDRSFNTFYSNVADRQVITLYRQVKSHAAEKYIDETISLSDVEVVEKISNSNTEDAVDVSLVLEKVKQIGEKEYKILKYYLEGNKYNQIAKLMNMKTKSVSNYLQKIRDKLRKWQS